MRSNDAELLYLERKIGIGNSWRYKIGSFSPLIIIMLITAILVFSITFISSMSDAIERAIIYLGSGDVYSDSSVNSSVYSEVAEQDLVLNSQGILYSETGEGLVYLKGVDPEYFTEERSGVLHLDNTYAHEARGILISNTLASSLSLAVGDKLTLLYYDEAYNRSRPVLLTVSGIFNSGYVQLDKYLAFVDRSLLEGSSAGYEIILRPGVHASSFASELRSDGYNASSYDQLYSSLYSNVKNSVSILYLIFAIVAFLAAFFSTDAAHSYIERDKTDIAAMMLLGLSERRIRIIYLKITMFFISMASCLGVLIGILLSQCIPLLMHFLAEEDAALLQYYIASFEISVPAGAIIAIVMIMIAVSAVSVCICLRALRIKDLDTLVKGE